MILLFLSTASHPASAADLAALEKELVATVPTDADIATALKATTFVVKTPEGNGTVNLADYGGLQFQGDTYSYGWGAATTPRAFTAKGALNVEVEEANGLVGSVNMRVLVYFNWGDSKWSIQRVVSEKATDCEGITGPTTRMGTPAFEGSRLVCHASR